MPNKPTMTLSISPQERDTLRAIAEEYGCYIGRGLMARDGSIQQLMQGIASGELVVVPHKLWFKLRGDTNVLTEIEANDDKQ